MVRNIKLKAMESKVKTLYVLIQHSFMIKINSKRYRAGP